MATNRPSPSRGWNDQDRQAFADRNILKAQRIPNKKRVTNKRECREFKWNS
jgi:hypothetical protein